MGNAHRPFYRVVVAAGERGRDGAAKEMIGSYNPVTQPKQVKINKERALHWLLVGAQPTETVANLFKREGILDEFFAQRPTARESYKFLDKRTSAMSSKPTTTRKGMTTTRTAVRCYGSPSAIHSGGCRSSPTATTMYCLP